MGRTSNARDRLIDAANELIWNHSYGAVTIEMICEQARVRKGSFYYFFDSKSTLAATALLVWGTKRKQLIEELAPPEAPPLERIWKYLDLVAANQIAAYEKNGRVLGCPFFTLGSEICKQDEQLRSVLQEILAYFSHTFEEAIRRAQASGDLKGTDAAMKGRLLWAYYEGTLTRARIKNDPELLRTLSADARALMGARQLQLS